MKILMLSADRGGCFKYRLDEPARVTANLGVTIEISSELKVEGFRDPLTNIMTITEVKTDADAIIFQRPLGNEMSSAIMQAKRQGIATIVELDDDFLATDKDNQAYPAFFSHKHSGVEWLMKACGEADFVTTSTIALQDKYAVNKRGAILKNYVPESIFNIKPRYERVDETSMLGWTGSVSTHPHDLQVTRGVVGDIAKEYGLGFTVIGDSDKVARNLNLHPETPVHNPGWIDLSLYYEAMAHSIDIGIVPLNKSPFNQAKSYLKGMEMAALGIPFVASDSYEYRVFQAYGVGQLATKPNEWRRNLTRLVEDRPRMIRTAKNYRDKIREDYTYEQHAMEWVTAWERAIDIRKKM